MKRREYYVILILQYKGISSLYWQQISESTEVSNHRGCFEVSYTERTVYTQGDADLGY